MVHPDLDQAESVGASHFVPIVRYLSLSLDIDLNSRFALKEQRGGLGPGAAEKLALISSGSRGQRLRLLSAIVYEVAQE